MKITNKKGYWESFWTKAALVAKVAKGTITNADLAEIREIEKAQDAYELKQEKRASSVIDGFLGGRENELCI